MRSLASLLSPSPPPLRKKKNLLSPFRLEILRRFYEGISIKWRREKKREKTTQKALLFLLLSLLLSREGAVFIKEVWVSPQIASRVAKCGQQPIMSFLKKKNLAYDMTSWMTVCTGMCVSNFEFGDLEKPGCHDLRSTL